MLSFVAKGLLLYYTALIRVLMGWPRESNFHKSRWKVDGLLVPHAASLRKKPLDIDSDLVLE